MSEELNPGWVSSACTLPTVEQPLRVQEFDELFAESLVAVEQVGPTRARLVLTGRHGLAEQVQDLTDRETSCCSFFSFTQSPSDGGEQLRGSEVALDLDVEVPSAHADVLAALVERARVTSRPTRTPSAPAACCSA